MSCLILLIYISLALPIRHNSTATKKHHNFQNSCKYHFLNPEPLQLLISAVLVTDSGKCLAIVRIEDASLSELANIFVLKVRLSWLPPDSVILLSVAGYLAGVGTAAYAKEFAESSCRLKNALPADVLWPTPPYCC